MTTNKNYKNNMNIMNSDEHTLENDRNNMDAHHNTRKLLTVFKKGTQSKQNELTRLQQTACNQKDTHETTKS